MRVQFSGASDDLIHVTKIFPVPPFTPGGAKKEVEEYNVYEKNNYAATFGVTGSEGAFKVHAIYDGCWTFAPGLWDEGDNLPPYLMNAGYYLHSEINDYSLVFAFDCSDKTKVFLLKSESRY